MISIYDYEDTVEFIQDYLKIQKQNDTSFSLNRWAKTIGLNSSATIVDVLKRKKKLKGRTLSAVSEGLNIDGSEKMYFQLLAEKDSFVSDDRKRLYNLLIKEVSPKYKEGYLCKRFDEETDVFSHWIYMAILTSTRLKNFKLSAENFANLSRFDVKLDVIQKAIQNLVDQNLIEKNANGELVAVHAAHSTPTDVRNKKAHVYFDMVCDLAKQTLSLDTEKREVQCLSLALPKDQLPLAKDIIRKCRHQLESLVSEEQNNSLYQVNLVMFPLFKD